MVDNTYRLSVHLSVFDSVCGLLGNTCQFTISWVFLIQGKNSVGQYMYVITYWYLGSVWFDEGVFEVSTCRNILHPKSVWFSVVILVEDL